MRVFAYHEGATGSGTTTPHTNGIQLGTRNKIAVVFDSSVGVKIFVNGDSTPMGQTLGSFNMKDVIFLEGGSQARAKTLIHSIQAYNKALTDQEAIDLTTL